MLNRDARMWAEFPGKLGVLGRLISAIHCGKLSTLDSFPSHMTHNLGIFLQLGELIIAWTEEPHEKVSFP